jgi:hypothetical protein
MAGEITFGTSAGSTPTRRRAPLKLFCQYAWSIDAIATSPPCDGACTKRLSPR